MGSLRGLQREARLEARPDRIASISLVDEFLNSFEPHKKISTHVRGALNTILTEPYSDALILGPAGSGRTTAAVLSTLFLVKEINSKPDPWAHYNINPSHSFNIVYLSDYIHGVFSTNSPSPVLKVMDDLLRHFHFLPSIWQRFVNGFNIGRVHIRFETLKSTSALTMGYSTFAIIADSEILSSQITDPFNNKISPKDRLPKAWRNHILNSRNLGKDTIVFITKDDNKTSQFTTIKF